MLKDSLSLHARFPRLALAGAFLALLLLAPQDAMAIAGGGTGGGGGGGGGGFSGGGGSSGSGSDCTSDTCNAIGIGVLVLTGLVVLAALGVHLWIRARRKARKLRVEQAARRADADDGYWDPVKLEQRVRECFLPIQLSWEDRDVEPSRPYVSDALYERHKLQLEGLEKQHRRNRIADLKLNDVRLVRIHNVTDDGQDRFVVHINCSARDWMEDTRTGEFVNGNMTTPTTFNQYWSFVRHAESGWVLDEIQQFKEGGYHEKAKLVNSDDGPLAEAVGDGSLNGAGTAAAAPAAVATAGAPAAKAAWDGANGAAASGANGHTPANWYPDPGGAHKWRWWDGDQWSAQTAD